VVEVATPSLAQTKVTTSLSGSTVDPFSHVPPPPISPPSPPHKCGHFSKDEARRCHHYVLSSMVAFSTMEFGSFDEEEGSLRVPQPSRPSDVPGASNVEDSLNAPELRLHIVIEVVGHLRLPQ
jgi:hypothetical protein